MTLRFGKRSDGKGLVKAGHRPWSILLGFFPPMVSYTDPVTGDGISIGGWNLPRSVTTARRHARSKRLKRLAVRAGFLERMDEPLNETAFEQWAKLRKIDISADALSVTASAPTTTY